MKLLMLSLSTLCLSLLMACQSRTSTNNAEPIATNTSAPTPVTEVKVSAGQYEADKALAAYPTEHYALYIPKGYKQGNRYPVLIFLDPHASGDFPVSLYKPLADQFGMILMGSNDSKNGIDPELCKSYAGHLLDECKGLPVDMDMTAICGFSGGAKIACLAASTDSRFHFLIISGAVQPFQAPASALPMLVYAGNADMNYSDLISYFEQQKSVYPYPKMLVEFGGKHEWPDINTYKQSCYFLTFNAMKNGKLKVDDTFVADYQREMHAEISAAKTDLRKCELLQTASDMLSLIGKQAEMEKQLKALKEKSSLIAALSAKQSELQREQSLKAMYQPLIGLKDLSYWKGEVQKLQHPAKASDKPMLQRVLGFLSLAGYSYSARFINQGDFGQAQNMLNFYAAVDPSNPDQPYLSALCQIKQGNELAAISELQRAKALGMTDFSKCKTEPAFRSLNGMEQYENLFKK